MTLNGVIAVTLRYFTEFGKHTFQHVTATSICGGIYALLRRSRSFKVTDFGTNRKPIYDFLLVINTNLRLILHRFQVMADHSSNFR